MPRSRSARTASAIRFSGPLAGCHGARRGTYRIVYRIDEGTRTVHVLDIDNRSDIYHRLQT
jgi:mRNA-degrading endonuclease RelE of RelBE toxin-antitoxin system